MRIFLFAFMSLSMLLSRSQSLDSLETVLANTKEPGADLLLLLADNWMNQDQDKSLKYAERALAQAQQDQVLLYEAYMQVARCLEAKGAYDEALKRLDKTLSLTEDSLQISDYYYFRGNVYESQSALSLSLENHLKALQIRKRANDDARVARSRNSIAFVYRGMQQQEKAIDILMENLQACEQNGDQECVDRSTFNIGLMKLEMNEHGEAIPWFRRAVAGKTEKDQPWLFSMYYNNLANCFEKLLHVNADYYDSALYYGHRSLELKKKIKNTRGIANSHNQLAATYERASDYEQSFYHASEALRVADSLGFKPIKLNALNYLVTAELGLKRIEKTNDHFVDFIQLQAELFDEAKSELLAEMTAKYEKDKQEAENKLLKYEAVEQRQINLLLIGLLVILGVSIVLLYLLIRNKHRMNSELVRDKQVIEEQANTLRNLDHLKSNFFASISHELRTPLTLIQGHSEEIMRTKRLPNSAVEPLRKIKRNIHQLSVMVDDLLDLSRLELQQRSVNLQPVDINGALRRLCGAFTSMAESKQISFSYDRDTDGTVPVLLDENHFEKVINNLIYNAFKFVKPKGKISVGLSTAYEEEVRIEIADSGIGLSAEELPMIFDRFFQPKSQTPQSFGSGMGLSIAKELTELMGGKIQVSSEQDSGTTFTLSFRTTDRLPQSIEPSLAEVNHTASAETEELLEIPSDTTVLIVEDNNDVREYLSRVLKDHFTLMKAANGLEALEMLEKQTPDLILTDVMMPVMNGWELLEKLQNKPELSRIPVIVLTAVAENEERVKGLRMGVDDYLLKPFEAEELLIRISNVVNNLRARIKWAKEFEGEEKSRDLKEENQLILSLKDFVQDHIEDKHLTVAHVATHLGLSERQLYRKTSELVGLSPSKLIVEIKLQHARQLLLSQRFSKLAQISGAVGFDSTQYFSKLYLERFGKKPADYFS